MILFEALAAFRLGVSTQTAVHVDGRRCGVTKCTRPVAFGRVSDKSQRRRVLVYVRGGKTKMMQCEARSTVGAMREEMGVPLDAVILLLPGRRELDDENLVGEIVREGPMTVEVRCRGVGGGELEDEALGYAAFIGNRADVICLLAIRANVNAKNKDSQQTPLHRSTASGHARVSRMLVRAKANVHALDNEGRTPLHWSADNGRASVSQMLIRAHADVHATDNEGKTPLDIAAQLGHSAVVALLQQESAPLIKSAGRAAYAKQ
eukprot:CAMPEP_0175838020 /NCGR_PEP_ID=MMETSP0107_2-20121207/18008_1 /TAXON_ID=195067 ORGANISM="Goniomonas pacifica, Strain CCMP1869" /NCGR_SAMPLE_ID=MMETSP0107_2 /ASSEMBLY_ACC=CAM_ASM_000203 /LENGTH=262 /DNA_ID=CAMNT_0017151563 /DNA_START=166 /DNA_END=954 /DNA_ORIENTATION=+